MIKRCFEQSASQNHHSLCYELTTNHLLLKICPKIQVLSSPFSVVDKLLDEQQAKKVRRYFLCQFMSMFKALMC